MDGDYLALKRQEKTVWCVYVGDVFIKSCASLKKAQEFADCLECKDIHIYKAERQD